jgi:hypothetical protein
VFTQAASTAVRAKTRAMLAGVPSRVIRWIVFLVLAAVLGLTGWMIYANVFSDDSAVRASAEQLARETAGCGARCKIVRTEGSRGVFEERIGFNFEDIGMIVVTCHRAYIAFGGYACAAARP